MDVVAPVRAFDRFQRRHAPLAITVAVLRNFSDQGAGNNAALIAYWGFFSIFPLLLLFVTILAFVLHGDATAQHSIEQSVIRQFPIIGQHPGFIRRSGAALGIGIVGTLISGLGVTVAAENAFNRVYAVPHRKQPNFLIARWRGLKLLAVVGVLQVVSTIASGLVSAGFGGVFLTIGGIVVSLALNLCLFFVAFRFLTSGVVPTRELWPGIVLAAVGWEILQTVGGIYVGHVLRGASQTYGTFATVIGFLAWLYLGARIVVYAAEINVVLSRHLWPRSIMDPPEPADRKARAALAKMEERDDKETVEVAFHPPDKDKTDELHHPPYAVAPRPAPGEHARVASATVAAPDLHTLTVAHLLDAVAERLERVDTDQPTKRQVRDWLGRARQHLPDGGGGSISEAEAATLVEAIRDALGLRAETGPEPAKPAG
jgi:membrane protein